jgi:hypothetical protein
LGQFLWCFALVGYARFVVLDIEGLIPPRAGRAGSADREDANAKRPALRLAETPPTRASKSAAAAVANDSGSSPSSSKAALAAAVANSAPAPEAGAKSRKSEWIDGSQPESDWRYDDESDPSGRRKLSKAERKQMRKLKDQTRAA